MTEKEGDFFLPLHPPTRSGGRRNGRGKRRHNLAGRRGGAKTNTEGDEGGNARPNASECRIGENNGLVEVVCTANVGTSFCWC